MFSISPKPQAGGPTLVGCTRRLIPCIHSYSPYLEAVPPTSAIRGQLADTVNAVMDLRFPQNAQIFLTSREPVSFFGRTLFPAVVWLFIGDSAGEKPRDEPIKFKQWFCFLRQSRAYRISRVLIVVKFVCLMLCLLSTSFDSIQPVHKTSASTR